MSTRPADLFDRCREFGSLLGELKAKGLYEALYRVTLAGPLDHRITVVDPFTSRLRDMVCFDSNSYLGLHRHPRVLRAARRALARFGAGTPSAPLLGGTSTLLRELERTVSDFHGREAAIVFPSGYAANVGLLTALVGRDDIVACDRFSHASLRDGVRFAGPRRALVYRHRDVGHLERLLAGQRGAPGARLVATDGVFSMHGSTAPLPALRRAADAHGARLLVDEAHSVGVLGPTGRGLEEAFEMPGAIDILMGTFSKAPGAAGGYVTGSAELVDYLRFHARAGVFTASLPAPVCASLVEAFRVMREEPEHRERLHRNARRLWSDLRARGLLVPPLESPIVPVFVGGEALLFRIGRDLFDRGLKCGIVCHPAVPRGEAILRLSVCSRHTEADLDFAVETLGDLGSRHGLLGRSAEELREMGRRHEGLEPERAAA